MHQQLRWIEEAQASIAKATSVQQVRDAVSSVLTQFERTGLKMPIGLLTELRDRAKNADESEVDGLKASIGKSLISMRGVHEAMLRMAGEI